MARRQSPCFRGGEFSCISCHEMHLDSPNESSLQRWTHHAQLKPHMDGDAACLQCHKTMAANITAHTHHEANFRGQPLLQLPHAAHDIRVAARHAQPPGFVAQRARKRRLRSTERLQSLSSRQNAGVDLAKTSRVVQADRSQSCRRTIKTISAAVQWIVKGDAGQRALIAWGMGWEPAQKISGRDWLYPYLIYSLTDSYAGDPFRRMEVAANIAGLQRLSVYLHGERARVERGRIGRLREMVATRARFVATVSIRKAFSRMMADFAPMFSKNCAANVTRNRSCSRNDCHPERKRRSQCLP